MLIVKVADSMFVEYLQSRGFDFTLSVFLPESGLDNPSQVRIMMWILATYIDMIL